jgi:hypothetical protein
MSSITRATTNAVPEPQPGAVAMATPPEQEVHGSAVEKVVRRLPDRRKRVELLGRAAPS